MSPQRASMDETAAAGLSGQFWQWSTQQCSGLLPMLAGQRNRYILPGTLQAGEITDALVYCNPLLVEPVPGRT